MVEAFDVRCRCGAVRGRVRVTGALANRATCHCHDCRAYAAWIGPGVADAHGGTPIVAIPPASLELTHGREHLRALRLSDRGLVRWYADCCRTPVGNVMPWEAPPFVGLFEQVVVDGPDVLPALAGPSVPVQVRSTGGAVRETVGGTLRAILKGLRIVATGVLLGRRRPTPFPPATPERVRVLTQDERARLGP